MDVSAGLEATLESLLAPGRGYDAIGGGASIEWEVEDDPDLASEPLLQLDMHVREDEVFLLLCTSFYTRLVKISFAECTG